MNNAPFENAQKKILKQVFNEHIYLQSLKLTHTSEKKDQNNKMNPSS